MSFAKWNLSLNYRLGVHNMLILCALLTFVLTLLCNIFLKDYLPQDRGKKFVKDGAVAKGKATGAGIIFILVFVALSFAFFARDLEMSIYLAAVAAAMLTGFLDDRSEGDWGRLIKGVFDLVISLGTAVTYVYFNGSEIYVYLLDTSFKIPAVVFVILAVLLIFVSINVINCTDGVDGLCGTLTIVTLMSFLVIYLVSGVSGDYIGLIISFMMAILAYLFFNWEDSTMLMGDGGSRAIGVFVAIIALKSGAPLLFIPLCLVFIVDGGLGLFKILVIKATGKKNFLSKIKCPIHYQVKEVNKWQRGQIAARFSMVSAVICFLYIALAISRFQ